MSGAYASTSNAADSSKFKLTSIGGAYDLGVVRPSISYTQSKYLNREQKIWTVSATAPLGQGQLWGSFTDAKANTGAETAVAGYTPIGDAKLFAAGYIYNLSKRTALYTTFSQLKNNSSGHSRFVVGGAPAATADGQKSSGYDVGIRHSF